MNIFLLIMAMILWASSAYAANWYVDNSVSSSGNGRSWATAWKNISNINYASVNAGDTINISGGTTSQTYYESLGALKSGTAGNIITIRTGQDAGHNGTVIFNTGSSQWIRKGSLSYFHVTGNVGGANHMQVTANNFVWKSNDAGTDTISNVHLSYIDFPACPSFVYMSNFTTQTALEFDHLMVEKIYNPGVLGDSMFYNIGGFGHDVPYDSHLVHHNRLYTPASGPLGDDMMKWGTGYSFYRNYVTTVIGTYPGGQHADVFQINLSHYKIYNNIFENVGESLIFYDLESGVNPSIGLLIYNNLFVNSVSPQGVSRAMDLFVKAPAAGSTFTDFIVANNTFVDWTDGVFAVRIHGAASYTNVYVQNNLFKNSSGLKGAFALDVGIMESNNSSLNSTAQFVSYAQYAVSTNNLHLDAGDMAAKNLGVTLASPMSNRDYDGVMRPKGSAWDLGAYEFVDIVDTATPNPPRGLQVK